jgi:hypothetical protein
VNQVVPATVGTELADLRGPRTLAPRNCRLDAGLGLDTPRHFGSQHPVAMCQKELDGRAVLVERVHQVPLLVVALADHRVKTNRVDPAALGACEAPVGGVAKVFAGVLELTVVVQSKSVEIPFVRHAFAGLGKCRPGSPGKEQEQGGGRNLAKSHRGGPLGAGQSREAGGPTHPVGALYR